MNLHPDWLIPDWSAPANVQAVCTTRIGGVSAGPFDSFNLGDHVGDDIRRVDANRAALTQAIGAKPVFLSQVHGTQVERLCATTANGAVADAASTGQSGLACTVMVADCLPVLFTNRQGTLIAAAHAGWRGLAGVNGWGVLEAVIDQFRALAPVHQAQDAIDVIAWLGPCIGPTAFEVGPEVREAFLTIDAAADAMFVANSPGKWFANLAGLARQRLHAQGVQDIYGNDGSQAWCTVSRSSQFFSYRRDGVSGRFAASIWMR